MIFNSIPFIIFFVVFFCLYWYAFRRNLKLQNLLILAGSYFFYAWWDWRLLFLLIGSSLMCFLLGLYMDRTDDPRKKNRLMYAGVWISVALLVYFKYTNFFIQSFIDAFDKFHVSINLQTMHIILPLGISFYTFRNLNYLFDVNKGKAKATNNWVIYFSYVSFFPSLISGPIDKAKVLIPELEKERHFDYKQATDGLRQIAWGLFKKIVVADNVGTFTNEFFGHYQNYHGSTLLVGAFYFTIQLYADFSGYSDMAIGLSKLLGFTGTKNFDYPFFSQNIEEYWRKWHISLTSWLSEYIFTPASIKFRDYANFGLIISILITFLVSGFWHGANWTFVVWGILNGCYYIPLILQGKMNKKKKKGQQVNMLPSFKEFRNIVATFTLVALTNILFRSANITQAFGYYKHLFSRSLLSYPANSKPYVIVFLLAFLVFEWSQRDKQHSFQLETIRFPALRWSLYFIAIYAIFFNI
ncbi:MAG: hypothetical protein JWM28_147, partial [Chitinophagaceae bacterium]|nr:hypothetical protein [Chitinophagaceae bacterium]